MRTVTGLNVTVWGEGEPIVLVHGSFGWSEKTWAEQRPHERLRAFSESA